MNKNVVNSLLLCKQDFDIKYQEFAYKHDLDAVFQFEYQHYITPISENIIPLIYKDIKDNPSTELKDYLPYISSKYHNFIVQELTNYEKTNSNLNRNLGKKLLEAFSQHLISYSRKDPQEQETSLFEFFKNHSHIFKVIIKNNPSHGLEVCSRIRNPKFQNILINHFHKPLYEFINSKNDADFKKDILPYFIYPKDIGVQDYYNKWIAKEAFHIKLSKPILGEHYENAKDYLKQSETVKSNKKTI